MELNEASKEICIDGKRLDVKDGLRTIKEKINHHIEKNHNTIHDARYEHFMQDGEKSTLKSITVTPIEFLQMFPKRTGFTTQDEMIIHYRYLDEEWKIYDFIMEGRIASLFDAVSITLFLCNDMNIEERLK